MAKAKEKIFIMTSVHPWNDPRIFYKEACSLRKKYQVEVHAPADFKLKEEKGVIVYGLPIYARRCLRFLNWGRLLIRALKSSARYVHFHDPELIPIGVMIKLLTRKKVIYDVHENFPASIRTKLYIPGFMRGFLARVLDFWEIKAARYFDGILLAEYSYVERFRPFASFMETVVNFPPLSMGTKLLSKCEKGVSSGQGRCIRQAGKNSPVKFVYAGVISKSRGIEEMIRSFALVREEGLDFQLYLAGSWVTPELRQEVEELIRSLKFTDQVTITGKIPFYEMADLYRRCDVGLALLHPEKNYLTSLATKIFEYMAAGIPVLASDFPLWKLMLMGHQCGVTANPLNVQEISEKISLLVRKKCWRCRLGLKGWQVFHSHYNWETQEKKLWEFYQSLES